MSPQFRLALFITVFIQFLGSASAANCHQGSIEDELVGTFAQGSTTIFCHQHALPQKLSVIKPEFLFFAPDPDATSTAEIIKISQGVDLDNLIKNLVTDFESKQVFILTHGFGANWPKDWAFTMKEELIKLGHVVGITKWVGGSEMPNYYQAASNTRIVGAGLGLVIEKLVLHKKLSLDKTTLVGFSLGAQVSGFAGEWLKSKNPSPGLKRIIGIDAAGPLFEPLFPGELTFDSKARLDSGDADFVMAVHCNGGSLFTGNLGVAKSIGHIDLFANGGETQPGCLVKFDLTHLAFGLDPIDELNKHLNAACSHLRCPQIVTSIIKASTSSSQCQFTAFPCQSKTDFESAKCTSCGVDGKNCITNAFDVTKDMDLGGNYYFQTSDDVTNLCVKQYSLTLEVKKNIFGSIEVFFTDNQSNNSPEIKIQGLTETLTKKTERSYLIKLPASFSTPKSVSIKYINLSFFSFFSSVKFTKVQLNHHKTGVLKSTDQKSLRSNKIGVFKLQ